MFCFHFFAGGPRKLIVIDSSVSISTTITIAYTDQESMMNGDNRNMLRVTNINQ